jgi:hypothetical protein
MELVFGAYTFTGRRFVIMGASFAIGFVSAASLILPMVMRRR